MSLHVKQPTTCGETGQPAGPVSTPEKMLEALRFVTDTDKQEDAGLTLGGNTDNKGT